jgi:error-prone DNA polymerase
MPEVEFPKFRPQISVGPVPVVKEPYAELQVTSNFSFLRGGSHPEELVARAAELGYRAIAVTDVNSLAGIVRAYAAAKNFDVSFIVGCHLQVKAAVGVLADGAPKEVPLSLLVYPTDRASYGRLCRMLTYGKRRTTKGQCELTLQDVTDHQQGLLAIVLPPPMLTQEFTETLHYLSDLFDEDRLSLAASCLYDGRHPVRLAELAALSKSSRVPMVATNDVHYHTPQRKPLQDVLTCVRLGCTLNEAGFSLFANAERHLKEPQEMARLFQGYPQTLQRTLEIAERASSFSLRQLKYEYPSEVCPQGQPMMAYLIEQTWKGAQDRYPNGIPETIRQRLEHEFNLIRDLNYPAYFLTVYDIVSFARSKNILCQGRGAAANSAVCYCLGITSVDPSRIDLLVERFMSRERDEPPDIDIDFEHERREEVIQHIYQKYGRERAALTAEVISYRRKSAVRDVRKALGLSLDCVDTLAKSGDWWDNGVIDSQRLRELGFDPHDTTIRQTVELANELIGFPRHLSQHVGGFVLSQQPLCEFVPIENAAMENRTVIEWDKDDIDELGMMKVDVLGLGMLTCVRKAIDLVNQVDRSRGGKGDLQFHTIPQEDEAVYDMLCKADSVGVFQVESRAQMTMLPRLKPRNYYDLVIEVAIVRPGPIQGGMVHPYLRRRTGSEEVTYPSEAVKSVLERTLGVPLFQEQAMKLVMVAAGFTAGEADQLRRAMAAWKRKGYLIERFTGKILSGMAANGYTETFAQRVVQQIKGFADYGFPESHAASFAHIVYVSAWLKCRHPAAFAAAILNSQPMGFYQPSQLVRDANEHGVSVFPVDVNYSQWDCTLEDDEDESPALRLGMRLVAGVRSKDVEKIAKAVVDHASFSSIAALWRLSGAKMKTFHTLAKADAFGSMGIQRQQALWEVGRLKDDALPMFDSVDDVEPKVLLPTTTAFMRVIHDYTATGLSLKAHPISFARKTLNTYQVTSAGDLADEKRWPHGRQVAVAGLVLVRQRPGTASGILFVTLEDETGVANLVVRPPVYERYRKAIRHSTALVAWGKIERQGQVVHILLERAINLAEISNPGVLTIHARNFR